MQCKSGRTYVRRKIFEMDRPSPKLFFQKNRLPNKIISKNQVSRRNIFSSFLKVLATFYKEISKIISTIFMKER